MTCAHHWVIEDSRNATAPGQCKHCGATKMFRNQIDWGGAMTINASRGREVMCQARDRMRAAQSEAGLKDS